MTQSFTREEFYDLVWSKPMTHLAKEFRLSDVALHKICKKHDIPKPPLGWWAKKQAGKPVKQTPLPAVAEGMYGRISITAGELRGEPEMMAIAREEARIAASSIDSEAAVPSHPIIERTAAKLRKAKADTGSILVSAQGAGVVRAQIGPDSVDRFEQVLNRIVAAAATLGIGFERGDKAAVFLCDDEVIGFSVSEFTRREKHVLTEKERNRMNGSAKATSIGTRAGKRRSVGMMTMAIRSRPDFPSGTIMRRASSRSNLISIISGNPARGGHFATPRSSASN